MRGFLALDLETTGLDKEKDRIVEFCFLQMDPDLNEKECWTERLNPGIPIPDETAAIHGIRDADVRGCPAFAEFAPRIQALTKEHVLVGYNLDYDADLLHYELTRAGQPGISLDHPRADALSFFRQFVPDLYKLTGAVRHYLKREHEGAHGALADTKALAEVLRKQREVHAELGPMLKSLFLPRPPPENQWLDRSKKFYVGPDGVVRFGFGQNKDKPVAENLGMLEWMIARDFPEETKAVARRLKAELVGARTVR